MPRKKKQEKVIQPEVSIGLVGHVDHGKTTLVKALSGKWTDTHSEELKRGITIRLGYADATFYYCKKSKIYTVEEKGCKDPELKRKVSFVDAPGHESLMATMLSGAAIMDGALLLVAANEECPQPQTREHLAALEIAKVNNLIIVQNKIDLVDEKQAMKNYKQIKELLKGTAYEEAPIIPISAQHDVNVDSLIEAVEKYIPTPKRGSKKDSLMFVARSFDINKPGMVADNIKGGVLGGAVKQGSFKIGDEIEICPGLKVEEKNQIIWKPLHTKIIGLISGGSSVDSVGPGGTIGILTSLDPFIVKSDSLSGSVVGFKGKLPPMWNSLDLEVHLLERVVGSESDQKVEPIKMNEPLMLNVNSSATVGIVTGMKKESLKCNLKIPVCAEKGEIVSISRRVGTRFRLIGYGLVQ